MRVCEEFLNYNLCQFCLFCLWINIVAPMYKCEFVYTHRICKLCNGLLLHVIVYTLITITNLNIYILLGVADSLIVKIK